MKRGVGVRLGGGGGGGGVGGGGGGPSSRYTGPRVILTLMLLRFPYNSHCPYPRGVSG